MGWWSLLRLSCEEAEERNEGIGVGNSSGRRFSTVQKVSERHGTSFVISVLFFVK